MADDSNSPATDFLEQSEVDHMLAQPAEAADAKGGVLPPDQPASRRKVEAYDFRNPVFLAEAELRQLRALHEDFVRYLSARLSLVLRMEFGLKLTRLSTVAYSKFTDALPNPTHLSLFKAEPLPGVGILEINPRLALTIADRLLGGRGTSIKAGRHLTEIEISLIEDVMLVLLEEWCGQWKTAQALKPVLIGHENTGRFLQTSPRDAIMLAVSLECSFGDCSEQIQIGVPYDLIEPVMKRMQARRKTDTATTPTAKRAQWQPAYDRIALPVRAEWDAFELTLREVCSLRVGDVLEMPSSLCTETRVLLNGTTKFVGTVGLDTDRVAVQLTRKPTSEVPFHAKSDGPKIS